MAEALEQKGLKKWAYSTVALRPLLNSATAVHCTAELEAESVRQFGLKPPVFVVPNPVDLEAIDGARRTGGEAKHADLP